jgi:two-component sensor histidine kinase
MLGPMEELSAPRRLDEEHLELALEVAGLGAFEWDRGRDLMLVSPRLAAMIGLRAGEIDGHHDVLVDTAIDEDRPLLQAACAALETTGRAEVEYRPKVAPTRWVRLVAQRAGGQMVGVGQDVTDRRIEDEQRQSLMAELDHRVKNVLAAVQALAFQTAKRTRSLDSFLTTFAGRLKAMGSANELLTAARWRGAAVDHLCAAELGGVAPGQTRWEGPELFLTPRAANALSLALHELATNALKYGALSTETGRVEVRWRRIPAGGFELMWTETGGPLVRPPTRQGFGTTLLQQVTGRELNGVTEVEYRPTGVQARLVAGPAAVVGRPETVPAPPETRIQEVLPAAAGAPNLKGSRVLIVEDAVLLALELETGLADAGATIVGPAYELDEAMALLDGPIDAAVLDANLNGHSVLPVAEVLAARGVPFLFATGYGESGAPGGYAAPVIRKPYDVTQVAAAVAALLKAA